MAAVVAVASGLLLTACGSGSGTSDKIQQSPTTAAAPTRTSATAPATQAAGPDAPSFAFPSGITVKFDDFDSSDPTKKAVLQDATYAADAVIEFEAKLYTKEPANFARFWTGDRGAQFADSIISQGKDGTVVTGAFHYYDPVVKSVGGGTMQVQYCEDQRKAYGKDVKTGKVDVTTPSLDDFNLWTLEMAKSPSGEWHAFDHKWVEGAKQCEL
jgi:hypothetical protein